MSFTRPTSLPEFASEVNPVGDPSRIVEPSGAKKLVGWGARERPPRNWMNWLHNLYYNWLGWLDQRVEEITAQLLNYDRVIEVGTFTATYPGAVDPVEMVFNYRKFASGLIDLYWNFTGGLLNESPHICTTVCVPIDIRPVGGSTGLPCSFNNNLMGHIELTLTGEAHLRSYGATSVSIGQGKASYYKFPIVNA